MSIYGTLWIRKIGAAKVYAQAVPPHIGSDESYPDGDPFGDFLPPPVPPESEHNRAVVFVTDYTPKGVDGCQGQEYKNPLLVLSGKEYAEMSWADLRRRLAKAVGPTYQQEQSCDPSPS